MEKDELKAIQAKHRKEAQEIRASIKARKERTHRLIVRGAIMEKAFPDSINLTDEQLLKALIYLCRPEEVKAYLEKTKRRG